MLMLCRYPRLLAFTPVVSQSFTMSMPVNRAACICPLIVSRGSDQMEMSTKFEIRDRDDVVRNYGLLLISMAKVVPDGMVVFFPSYLCVRARVDARVQVCRCE
jgi:DNA excision repair protein ERCC-2